jgi:hypothetical protein
MAVSHQIRWSIAISETTRRTPLPEMAVSSTMARLIAISAPQVGSGSVPGSRTATPPLRASAAKPASRVQIGMPRAAASTTYTPSYTVRFSANRIACSTRTLLPTTRGPSARRSATPSARCRRVNRVSARYRFLSELATSSRQRSGVHSSIFNSGLNRGATSSWAGPGARYSTNTLASTTTAASAIPILPHHLLGATRHHPGRPSTSCYPPSHPRAIYE